MAGIFLASSIPSVTALPGGMSDHQLHFLGYAILGLTFLHGTARGRWEAVGPRTALKAWGLAALYGASDEWHQSFVPGRFPAVDDWFADVLGAGVAILIVVVGAIGRRLESETV